MRGEVLGGEGASQEVTAEEFEVEMTEDASESCSWNSQGSNWGGHGS